MTTKTKTITFFIGHDRKLHRVCTRKHKNGHCGHHHAVPTETQKVLWTSTVSADLVGEMKECLKQYRKELRKAEVRWQKQTKRLLAKKCAPAFAAYLAKLKDDHNKAKPVFAFTYTERPIEPCTTP